MPVFLIVSEAENPVLKEKIKDSYPKDHFVLSHNQWLLDAEETTEEVAEKLGIRQGEAGPAIVFGVESQSGFHRKSVWEWLKLE